MTSLKWLKPRLWWGFIGLFRLPIILGRKVREGVYYEVYYNRKYDREYLVDKTNNCVAIVERA